ncbi:MULTISPECIES: helix-turn-helix domain-containing protein [Pseudomonas aeruginosa group]|uniref:Helix-turn-helix transcriptional regulator n=1 Tax=Pseudomonas nitroreducens TaxID=46680 RepID=A0A6G6IS59_PSENT|nr:MULTISPECIES: helix-turn-helix transcriptional regulator [Pseudomonas aeruginosa group]QIE85975.1 helix-turn-helix transcriptional regulator [Pseudomonas nitroreducens]HCE6398724.1 helix-turn-helix transcriptional regulator [Pseudomonas aeruginosa]
MQKRAVRPGRPKGARTYEAEPARAFGMAVRALRKERAIAQETLANLADIERSHMGKIERGEHLPTLVVILRIAEALNCTAAQLVADTESNLKQLRQQADSASVPGQLT